MVRDKKMKKKEQKEKIEKELAKLFEKTFNLENEFFKIRFK